MNFDESVSYLLSLGNEVTAMKLGLENITKLLAALGNPHNNYLKIQIAGTNGKGSTVAFLESISVQAGIKTGATTSPHLISITERIRINGAEISEKDFARLATEVRKTSESLVETGKLETVPTYFEQITATALSAFAEAKVELAILETGLGGRFDATTAAQAEIVAITPIDYDHQNILGNTLKEIAAEKAAIIRENSKVVIAPQKSEALEIIFERCREKNVVPIIDECEISEKDFPRVNFKTNNHHYFISRLGLAGKHQLQNACVAVNLAEVLRDNFKLEISDSAISQGLEKAEHAGRLEWKKINDVNFLFDGAHNISGAKALREYLDEFVKQPITMIFGAMRDKDLSEIAALLFPKAENLILTVPDNPRSLPTAEIIEYAPETVDRTKLFPTENVESAVTLALEIINPGELILITGSLYLVGEAQKFLRENCRENL